MADGPLNGPVLCGMPMANGKACALPTRHPGRHEPWPMFTHGRADGPFDPCAECAAIMSHTAREALFRDVIECLLMQMEEQMVAEGHDCATNGCFQCCRARRVLKATAVNRAGGDGVPPGAAVAPTGPGGGRPETPAAGVPAGLALGVGETIDVFIDSRVDGRPSTVTAVGETCLLAKVPCVGEMQIPLSAGWWRRRDKKSAVPLPAGGQVGRAP